MKLSMIILRCTNIEKSKFFYEALGTGPFTLHSHEGGPEHYSGPGPGMLLELYPAGSEKQDMIGLGFDVENIEKTRDALILAGHETGEIIEDQWGKLFVVRDPDMRRIEIRPLN